MSKHICQSSEWAKFKESYGNKPVKIGEYTFFKTKVPFLPLYVGYCPKADLTKVAFDEAKRIARKEKCIFVKFDPINLAPLEPLCTLTPSKSIFAQETILLDLKPPLQTLYANFKQKTRYNVGLAQRKGVVVREGKTTEDLETFLILQKKTAKRQGFYVHPDTYFRKMWEIFYPKGLVKMLIAEAGGKPAAAWIFFVYDNVFYYPYGASDYQFRDYMASDLMMWKAIELGKKLGCKQFDMWGATSNKNDPWWGFTRFKLGFGGELVKFADSKDLVINKPLYCLFELVNKFRWLLLKVMSKVR